LQTVPAKAKAGVVRSNWELGGGALVAVFAAACGCVRLILKHTKLQHKTASPVEGAGEARVEKAAARLPALAQLRD
jgi:hypothetical protein